MTARIEKTVFISYRRTNFFHARAVYENLDKKGYDIFLDYEGINSGDFEQIILGNIRARAHFLIILTPSALERCIDPQDWLRLEIETALNIRRNIIPLFFEGFSFSSPSIAQYLPGKLAILKNYNGINVPSDYFNEAMERLIARFLNIPISAVPHPIEDYAKKGADAQQIALRMAPKVNADELSAEVWFERGFNNYFEKDLDESIQCYTQAIKISPSFAAAYHNRGLARSSKGDINGAIKDLTEAIRIDPENSESYSQRGLIYLKKKDLQGVIKDANESLRLDPDDYVAHFIRGIAYQKIGDLDSAILDYTEAIRINPDDAIAYYWRGKARDKKGDSMRATRDFDEAIRINPDRADFYDARSGANLSEGNLWAGIKDLFTYYRRSKK